MDIKAFKMDGLGNDFVIIDHPQNPKTPKKWLNLIWFMNSNIISYKNVNFSVIIFNPQ